MGQLLPGEEFDGPLQNLDEAVDFFAVVVKVEAGAQGGRHAKLGHQRLVAVMTGPQGYPTLVHQGRHIQGMGVWQNKTDQAGAALLGPEDSNPFELLQTLLGVIGQLLVMSEDWVPPDGIEVLNLRS